MTRIFQREGRERRRWRREKGIGGIERRDISPSDTEDYLERVRSSPCPIATHQQRETREGSTYRTQEEVERRGARTRRRRPRCVHPIHRSYPLLHLAGCCWCCCGGRVVARKEETVVLGRAGTAASTASTAAAAGAWGGLSLCSLSRIVRSAASSASTPALSTGPPPPAAAAAPPLSLPLSAALSLAAAAPAPAAAAALSAVGAAAAAACPEVPRTAAAGGAPTGSPVSGICCVM